MQQISQIISKEQILSRITELAQVFSQDHINEQEYNFITVLKGAKRFSEDFVREVKQCSNKKLNNTFISLRSYGSNNATSGKVEVKGEIKQDIKNKKITIIEDIVDTGLTLEFLEKYLYEEKQVNDVKVVSLLDKPSRRKVSVKPDYFGFSVPNKFVVGYGIDFDQKYRELDFIGFLNEN